MTDNYEKFRGAAANAACDILGTASETLLSAGVIGIGTGAGTGPSLGLVTLGGLGLLATRYNCDWDPEGPGPPPAGLPQSLCFEGSTWFTLRELRDGEFIGGSVPDISKIYSIEFTGYEGDDNPSSLCPAYQTYKMTYQYQGSSDREAGLRWGVSKDCPTVTWDQIFDDSGTCMAPGPKPKPYPDVGPITYEAPDGCQLNVTLQGIAGYGGGNEDFVFKIEPSGELRNAVGSIGGCNFQPIIYGGNPDGYDEPPFIGPWDDDWDESEDPYPWKDKLEEIAEGVEGAATGEELDEKFDTPLPGVLYQLRSVCEVDANGNPIQQTIQVPIPDLAPWAALTARLDALIPLLQGQKDFKQPTCPPVKPEGEFRTIGFISEDYSPNGRNYLRKRLRYRSMSGIGLGELIDHWKDFEFDAGPVTVKHRGASWGTITVWASSADEGKRVIRHAAGEASIDADQVGRWEISGSSSSRLGMPGRMRVNNKGGFYWITERDGSSARPLVGTI